MITLVLIEAVSLLLLLLCSAFFSSAETAFFSLDPLQIRRLHSRHPHSGRAIEELLSAPTQLLSTILIGNTLVNVAAAALSFALCEALAPGRGTMIAIPAMTLVLLVFGEVAPKRLAAAHPERMSAVYAPILRVLVTLFYPLRHAMDLASRVFRASLRPEAKTLSEDEFLSVVEVGEEEGVLDEEERTMVDGIIGLEEMQVSEVMTPRVDLVGIDLDDSQGECRRTAEKVRFRYLPVYRESLDHAEGFLDVLKYLLSDDPDPIPAMIEPFFVPETMPLDALLTTMQREEKRVAFVVDEYGGTAGLATRGDILEEITPDVDNEYGETHLTIESLGNGQWLVDGSTSLDDVNCELDVSLEAEGADRIAGWVSAQAERIPATGETVEAQGVRATVQRLRKRRILLVVLEKLPVESTDEEDGV